MLQGVNVQSAVIRFKYLDGKHLPPSLLAYETLAVGPPVAMPGLPTLVEKRRIGVEDMPRFLRNSFDFTPVMARSYRDPRGGYLSRFVFSKRVRRHRGKNILLDYQEAYEWLTATWTWETYVITNGDRMWVKCSEPEMKAPAR